MTRQEFLSLVGDFTWDFGSNFFIQTAVGNFVWSDPEYQGNNHITKFNGSYKKWIKGSFGRSKGNHFISGYCGEEVTLDFDLNSI